MTADSSADARDESHDGLLLDARSLVKRYGSTTVVDGVDIRVARGEVVGLVGPNGAGKTTTLHMCLGLVPPSSGSVRRPEGARVGVLFDTDSLVPQLTPAENLRLVGQHAGCPVDADALLDRAGVERTVRSRSVRHLSHGTRRRVGLAAALIGPPALLVLDEPHNGLDPLGMNELGALVRQLAAAGTGVLVSSHAVAELAGLCDRVTALKNGVMVLDERVSALVNLGGCELWVSDVDRAVAVLAEAGIRADVAGERVVLAGGSVETAAAVRACVHGGIDVFQAAPRRRDLAAVLAGALKPDGEAFAGVST